MRKTLNAILIMALLIIFFMTLAHASEIKLVDGVLELTDDNWDQAIAKHDNLLITFYTPWW